MKAMTRRGRAFGEPAPAERPTTPNAAYGVPAAGGELVDWATVVQHLSSATAYWVATVSPSGRPHVTPVWGVMTGDDLYLTIGSADTRRVRNLDANSAVAVHLDDADDVVIVHGSSVPYGPGAGLGAAIAAAFAAKYAGYRPAPSEWDAGGLVRIVPESVLAWHDMQTATRWRFSVRSEPDGSAPEERQRQPDGGVESPA